MWTAFVLWTWLLIVQYLSFTSGRSFRLSVKNMIRLIYSIWYVIGVMDRLLSAAFHSCGEMWRLIWIIRKGGERERGERERMTVVISCHLFGSPFLILRPANKFRARVTEMCCLKHNTFFPPSVRQDTISFVVKCAIEQRRETPGFEWFMGQETMRICGLDRLKMESCCALWSTKTFISHKLCFYRLCSFNHKFCYHDWGVVYLFGIVCATLLVHSGPFLSSFVRVGKSWHDGFQNLVLIAFPTSSVGRGQCWECNSLSS
jgi:hypothetical protein